jgi:tetratricopeptide (TPR) repeat protein
VLALGGKPGAPHVTSAWEAMFAAVPAGREGRWADAIRMHEEALEEHPGNAALLYNLACMESRGGRPLDAILHLTQAVSQDPKWAEYAARDPDFDPIRPEPGFPA